MSCTGIWPSGMRWGWRSISIAGNGKFTGRIFRFGRKNGDLHGALELGAVNTEIADSPPFRESLPRRSKRYVGR
jgi:hypothetical protein